MTVGKLIDILEDYSPDIIVFVESHNPESRETEYYEATNIRIIEDEYDAGVLIV